MAAFVIGSDPPVARSWPPSAPVVVALATGMAALTLWSMLHGLGAGPLGDWDEATYAEIAREMTQRGDWLTPMWNGHAFYDKPPLVLWLMAVSLSSVPWTELAVRLVSAASGIGSVALTMWLTRRMLASVDAALIASLVLIVGSLDPYANFVQLARAGMLDVPLTLVTVWAAAHTWLAERDPRHWRFAGVALGVAIMVKSVAAMTTLCVIGTGVIYLAVRDRPRLRVQFREIVAAAALAAAIALPWHLMQIVLHGRAFIDSYFVQNVVDKATTAADGNVGGRGFYFVMLWRGFGGWAVLFVPAMMVVLWRAFRRGDRRAALLSGWTVMPFMLFAAARTKLAWYLVPVYPALAIATAWLVSDALPRRARLGTIAILMAATAIWNSRSLEPIEWTRDVKALGACVARAAAPTETIAYFDPAGRYQHYQRAFWNVRPSVRFYADRPVTAIVTAQDLDGFLEAGGRLVWAERSDAKAGMDARLRVAATAGTQVLLAVPSVERGLFAARECEQR
jgi:4-amino-4-deoxy-L-arabinose transferase-like glycosyltransferase